MIIVMLSMVTMMKMVMIKMLMHGGGDTDDIDSNGSDDSVDDIYDGS